MEVGTTGRHGRDTQIGDTLRRLALGVCAAALCLALPAQAAAALEPLSQVGGTGSGAGQTDPLEVAAGPNGDLYVTEVSRRISQFQLDGTFVRAWGWDVIPENGKEAFEVCTTGTGCKAGKAGGGPGQLSDVTGIAIDADGDVYVAEFTNARVSHFTAEGDFVNAWGFDVSTDPGGGTGFEVCTVKFGCKAGTGGGGPGQLNSANSIAHVPGGDLYVTEANGQRVSQFTTAGKFVRAWGIDVIPDGAEHVGFEVCTTETGCKSGSGIGAVAGQVTSPRGIAAGKEGHLFVSTPGRINEFTPTGSFVRAWGLDVIPNGTSNKGFEVCTTETGCKVGETVGPGIAGQLSNVYGITATPSGDVYAPDAGADRVNHFQDGAFVNTFGFDVITGGGTGFEVCSDPLLCKLGVAGSGLGQLNEPSGAAVDCRGALWVADFGADRLTRFGEPGTPTTCTDPPAVPPSGGTVTVKPSNGFTLGKAKLNRKKGTAKLPVVIPGAGVLALSGKGVKAATISATGPGKLQFPVDPTGKKRKALRRAGKTTVTVTVTYTPTGGDPNSLRATVNLKMKEASKATTGKGR
jgi:hypothetical protein